MSLGTAVDLRPQRRADQPGAAVNPEDAAAQVVRTALANPLDKFELGIKKLIEDLMIERMGENDNIVTRYMADQEFQSSAFPILAREIFEAVRSSAGGAESLRAKDRTAPAKS
jgi:hypothetical protein